jgi:hypothetical protein
MSATWYEALEPSGGFSPSGPVFVVLKYEKGYLLSAVSF